MKNVLFLKITSYDTSCVYISSHSYSSAKRGGGRMGPRKWLNNLMNNVACACNWLFPRYMVTYDSVIYK